MAFRSTRRSWAAPISRSATVSCWRGTTASTGSRGSRTPCTSTSAATARRRPLLGLDDRRHDHRPAVEGLAEEALQVALDQSRHHAAVGALLGGRRLDAPANQAAGLAQQVAL